MSTQDGAPALSIVVVAFNGPTLLQRCLTALARQRVTNDVEVVVVGHGESGGSVGEGLQRRFRAFRGIHAAGAHNVAQMRALGIAQSRGRIIALLEDDCLVPETWSADILEAHGGPDAAVGGAVEPGEYATALDWAVYFCEYGRFMRPLVARDAAVLPGTNVSYKRESLARVMPVGVATGEAPQGFYETFVHQALRRAGMSLRLDPALVVYNAHSWTPLRALRSRYHHGRGFAALRVAGRSWWRRAPYLLVAVALPVLQVARIVRLAGLRRRHLDRMGRALPWIVVCAVSWSLGEFMGYLLGPGDSLAQWR